MILYGSLTSPYARKVRIVIIEKDLDCEFIIEGPRDPAGNVARLNPLGKVPVLQNDDGEVLFDSPMIIDYLDNLRGNPLIPSGETRWQALRWQALGQGILDAVVTRMLELRRAPERQEPAVIKQQEKKVAAALLFANDHLTSDAFLIKNHFSVADISVVTALEYVDFRYAHDWRDLHPALTNWYNVIKDRPSFIATQPPKE